MCNQDYTSSDKRDIHVCIDSSSIAPVATIATDKEDPSIWKDPPRVRPPPEPPPDTMPSGSSGKKTKHGSGASMTASETPDSSKKKKQANQTKLPLPVDDKNDQEKEDIDLEGAPYPFNDIDLPGATKRIPVMSD